MKTCIFAPTPAKKIIHQVWTCSNPDCGARNDDSKSTCAYCGK